MFVGYVNSWTSATGTDIPFVTELNTNNKITNNNGTINLNTNGYWNVDASLSIVGTASAVSVTLYTEGVAKTTTVATATPASDTEYVNVSITDGIKSILTQNPNVGTISLRVNVAGATVSGKIRVEYVQ